MRATSCLSKGIDILTCKQSPACQTDNDTLTHKQSPACPIDHDTLTCAQNLRGKQTMTYLHANKVLPVQKTLTHLPMDNDILTCAQSPACQTDVPAPGQQRPPLECQLPVYHQPASQFTLQFPTASYAHHQHCQPQDQ